MYHNATICLNGHCYSKLEGLQDVHCKECGAECISDCPSCGAEIQGVPVGDFDFAVDYKIPKHCWKCGEAYPWAQK